MTRPTADLTRRRAATRAAAFVAASGAVLVLASCNPDPRTTVLPGGTGNGSSGYRVTATFADVDNLVANSAVQYHDIRIGTVDSIRLDRSTWHAEVKLALQKDVTLPGNVTARVGQTSLLGAEYVEIDDPIAPAGHLASGNRLSETSTGTYPGTEEVLSAVSLLLNNGGLSQIRTITTQLNAALHGREGVARSLLARLSTFIGDVDTQKRKLIATAKSLSTLTGKLAADRTTLAAALQRITPAVGTLSTDRPDLTTALKALSRLSTAATDVIDRNRANLRADLAALNPTLTKLAQAGKSLPDSLPLLASFPFSVNTVRNAVRGDYLNLFETLDLSLSSVQRDFLGSVPILGGTTVNDKKNPLAAPLQAVGVDTSRAAMSPTRPGSSTASSSSTASTTSTPSTAGTTPAPSADPASCPALAHLLGSC